MASVFIPKDNHDFLCVLAMAEVNKLADLEARTKEKLDRWVMNEQMGEFFGVKPTTEEYNEKSKNLIKFLKKSKHLCNVKQVAWKQIVEQEKNPNMLNIINEAIDEFLQAAWSHCGQDNIEDESKHAIEEFDMFKRLLNVTPDKTKKTRRGGKKHKKNKQAEEE